MTDNRVWRRPNGHLVVPRGKGRFVETTHGSAYAVLLVIGSYGEVPADAVELLPAQKAKPTLVRIDELEAVERQLRNENDALRLQLTEAEADWQVSLQPKSLPDEVRDAAATIVKMLERQPDLCNTGDPDSFLRIAERWEREDREEAERDALVTQMAKAFQAAYAAVPGWTPFRSGEYPGWAEFTRNLLAEFVIRPRTEDEK